MWTDIVEHGYPVVLLILGLAFMLIFKKQIGEKIGEIRGIPKLGLDMPPKQQTAENQTDKLPVSGAEDGILSELASPAFKAFEEKTRRDLLEKKIWDGKSTDRLVTILAAAGMAYQFEVLYQQIYGSQIKILQVLNERPTGAPVAALRPFYDTAAKQYPDQYKTYTFENYIAFLITSELVTVKDNVATISNFGAEFFRYIVTQRKTLNKVL